MGISYNLPTNPELKFLTNCKFHKGTLTEITAIMRLFNRSSLKFFMSHKSFRKFCKGSKLENYCEKALKIFSKGSPERVSIYELLSGIIVFSLLSWQQKVTLGFGLFDFNNDGCLNKDELQMLVSMYSNSILSITKFHIEPQDLFFELGKTEEDDITLAEYLVNRLLSYLSSDSYFKSFLDNTQPLPPLVRSLTPVNSSKVHKKKLTPILSNKPEHNYIDLPSGRFSKFLAISLKNAFNSVAENDSASPLLLSGCLAKIPELDKYSDLLEDLAILHDKVSFRQIIEIICSDAREDQINWIINWVLVWETELKKKSNASGKRNK